MPGSQVSVTNLQKSYGSEAPALRGISLEVQPGEFVALVGPSGCGKSTLLQLVGGMDYADDGHILIDDLDLKSLSDAQLSNYRKSRLGFVFQAFNLLPTLTVLENVTLPLRLNNLPRAAAFTILERIGLGDKTTRYPHQLSGGEQQRVAIARAVVHQPKLLIADEPTGNLDSTNGRAVLQLIAELHRELKATIILATHSDDAANLAERIIHLKDGRIC